MLLFSILYYSIICIHWFRHLERRIRRMAGRLRRDTHRFRAVRCRGMGRRYRFRRCHFLFSKIFKKISNFWFKYLDINIIPSCIWWSKLRVCLVASAPELGWWFLVLLPVSWPARRPRSFLRFAVGLGWLEQLGLVELVPTKKNCINIRCD